MAEDSFGLSKEGNLNTDSPLERREFEPPKWLPRHSGTFFPWRTKETIYSATSTSSSDDGFPLDPRTSHHRSKKPYRVVVTVLGAIGLVTYIIATAPLLYSAALAHRKYTCGSTIEEALAKGCTFDPMTVQWLPQQCSRKGLDEFLVAHGTHIWTKRDHSTTPDQTANESTWRYYTDETQSHEYVNGLVDAPVGHYTYVTTRGEHLAHCAYILVRGRGGEGCG